jgi:hypothetical protein
MRTMTMILGMLVTLAISPASAERAFDYETATGEIGFTEVVSTLGLPIQDVMSAPTMVVFWIDEVRITEIVCTKGYPSVRRQHQASLLSSTFVGGWDEDGVFTGTYHLTGRSADGPRTITEVIMEDPPCGDRGVPTGETITTYTNQKLYVGVMHNWKQVWMPKAMPVVPSAVATPVVATPVVETGSESS